MLPFVVNNLDRLLNAATAVLRDSGCSFTFRGPWLVGSDYLVTLLPAVPPWVHGGAPTGSGDAAEGAP